MPEFIQGLSNQGRIVTLCFCMWKLDFIFYFEIYKYKFHYFKQYYLCNLLVEPGKTVIL